MITQLGPYDLDTILTGDARELIKAIPDESVDLIFTDPVYQNVNDYRWLAEAAARILKTGGNLIAESGTVYLPDVLSAMYRSGLTWQTVIAEVYPRASCCIMRSKTMQGWKPFIWLRAYPKIVIR
jgi:DNA modification methylase